MAINILEPKIANRISAGEVVEKPASIVKELLDNALDAMATDITIEIEKGGIDLISIRDNGIGIPEEDIKKAFLPHATSKIATIEDLDNIQTLGFRGEALASISSVSQVKVISKTATADYASTLHVNGGLFGQVGATAGKQGTYIEVKNIFFNTPARRKFLRRAKTEEHEITNIIARYILAHPELKLKYIADGETIYFNEGKDLLGAICCVYGDDMEKNLLPLQYTQGEIEISGYVGKISYTKPNTTYQTLLINGRYVIDEGISKAMYTAYGDFLMSRQFPFYVLNLSMPYDQVDVNVHPSKMNVKFARPNDIFDIFYCAGRQAIYNSLNPIEPAREQFNIERQKEEMAIDTLLYDKVLNDEHFKDYYEQDKLLEISNEELNSYTPIKPKEDNDFTKVKLFEDKAQPSQPLDEEEIEIKPVNPIYSSNDDFSNIVRFEKFVPSRNATMFDEDSLVSTEENPAYQSINNFSDYKVIGEVFNEFLILEKGGVLLLLDFHAGHERLLYDKFLSQINTQQLVLQDLLIPYYHKVNVQEMDYLNSLFDQLHSVGFEMSQFAPDEVRISAVPAVLSDINLKTFVNDLLHDMKNQKPNINETLQNKLAQKACKSAVKAGMKLNDMQIKELLKDLDINNPVLLCPHGRPIFVVIKRSQLEKWFKRIV